MPEDNSDGAAPTQDTTSILDAFAEYAASDPGENAPLSSDDIDRGQADAVVIREPAQAKPTTVDFLHALFPPSDAVGNLFVCSYSNIPNDLEVKPKSVITRSQSEITAFVSKWDKRGRGTFVCMSRLKERALKRTKETVGEIGVLWADLDFKDIDFLGASDLVAEALKHVARLGRYQPSIITFSGGGLHCFWLLNEVMDAQAEMERIETLLHLLCDAVAGDASVCEVSRVMRLPGTHNSKEHIGWAEVEVIDFHPERRFDITEMEDWLAIQSPVMLRKVRERDTTVGERDPFSEYAKQVGYKPPIDVEARLKAMVYMGGGDVSIHDTQIVCTASLLNRNVPIDDVVAIMLAATRVAAGDYGKRWRWDLEERKIRKDCEKWVREHPPKATTKPQLKVVQGAVEQSGTTAATADGTVVQLPAIAKKPKDVPTVVVGGLINAIRHDGRDIMLAEGEVWIYEDGIWHIMTPAEEQWLRSLIQTGFDRLDAPKKTSALNNTWKLLIEHPELFKRKVEWADDKVIVCANGVLDIDTRQLHPHSPHWFARRKITTSYVAGATCPKFLELLTSMFSLHASPQAAVSVYQEWLGAALAISRLTREQRKGLLVIGKSRTGKTELSSCARKLIGEPIASPAMSEISETFGMMNFIDVMAWIRDDAVNEGDTVDAQRYKVIVTGEPVSIRRMNLPSLNTRLNMPVMLTANSLPHARDHSDAIYNRSIVLRLDRVISESEAVAMRNSLGVPRGQSIGEHFMETEASGVLNWALDGLARLLERGSFDLPDEIAAAVREFKEGNNPAAEFARIAIRPSPHMKVERGDVLCAYHGWQREEEGEEARAKGGRWLFPKLRNAFDDAVIGDQKSGGDRFLTGMELTKEGEHYWELHKNGLQLKNGSAGYSLSRGEVNRIWDGDAGDAKADDGAPF